MKLVMPKVVVSVPFSEYVAEAPGRLYVWVNPPMQKLQAYDALVADLQAQELEAAAETLLPDYKKEGDVAPSQQKNETILRKTLDQLFQYFARKKAKKADGVDPKLFSWYAEIWSQGPEDTHLTPDELITAEAQDPALISWMIIKTWEARREHVERKKKV